MASKRTSKRTSKEPPTPPANLGAWRRSRSNDALDWSPIEMLREILRQWEDPATFGPPPTKAVVIFSGSDDAGNHYNGYQVAGTVTEAETIGMMVQTQTLITVSEDL